MNYDAFLEQKTQSAGDSGFSPLFNPGWLFEFQTHLVDWAVRKGRAALFADTGLGKTRMELAYGENVHRKTNRPVLLLTPLAVGHQTVQEAKKVGVEAARSRDGKVAAPITVANYDILHKFDPKDYAGVICDESGILKHFGGETQKAVTRFTLKTPYRLYATATPSPNDFNELGTHSEALGYLGYSDMLSRFFKQMDGKISRMNDVKLARDARMGNHYARLAYRVSQQMGNWRLKAHAEAYFWRWVCSWARACRKPSDLGDFSDVRFALPPLMERHHIVKPERPADGMLFTMPAFGLQEERDERRRTLKERIATVVKLVDHDRPAVVWCHMNQEGDALEKAIKDSVQVSGADSDEAKEEAYRAFEDGDIRVMIVKPKIGAWGLNWQHCSDVVTFAGHSFEQHYQSIRRCWRFGQKRPVVVDVISTEGEVHVRDSMARKAQAADQMFSQLVQHMNGAIDIRREAEDGKVEVPQWLKAN